MTDLELLYKRLRSFALREPPRVEKWLDMVRSRGCCICSLPGPSDPHHIFGSVYGLKSSDLFTVPLCRKCHDDITAHPKDNVTLIEDWIHQAHDALVRGIL